MLSSPCRGFVSCAIIQLVRAFLAGRPCQRIKHLSELPVRVVLSEYHGQLRVTTRTDFDVSTTMHSFPESYTILLIMPEYTNCGVCT